jgi:hypothetical protein
MDENSHEDVAGKYDPILMDVGMPTGVAGRYDPILGIPVSSIVVAGRTATIYVEFNGPADGKTSCQFYYLRIAGTNVQAGKVSVGFAGPVPATTVSITPPLNVTNATVCLPTLATDVGTMVVFGRNSADAPNTWIALCTFLVQQ